MSIHIESWLFPSRRHTGTPDELVPVERFSSLDPRRIDWNYPEGAITLHYYDRELLGKAHWDIMDQLWYFFLRAAADYTTTGKASFYFPDQPFCVSLSKAYTGTLLLDLNGESTAIPETEFLEELYRAGRAFFSALDRIGRRSGNYIGEAVGLLETAGFKIQK